MTHPKRRLAAALALAVALASLAYAAHRGVQDWRHRGALARAETEMDRGDYASAAPRLAALVRSRPGDGEALYRLGECERALKRPVEALAAWSRVPPGSTSFAVASLARGRLALELGRFDEADQALYTALRDLGPGANRVELRRNLIHLYGQEGRLDEALALLEAQWNDLFADRPAEALDALRTHIAIDLDTAPMVGLRAVLDRASALAPNDPGVRLARANLALREGRLDDAGRDLTGLPDHPGVVKARLRFALAAHRAGEAKHDAPRVLKSGELTPSEADALDAWDAGRRGDRAAERAAWERLLAADPCQAAALDRLATLAAAEGDRPRAESLRRAKAALDDALQRYRTPYLKGALAENARDLASLAAALGRRFEARAFLAMALRRAPGDREARRALAVMKDRPPEPRPAMPLALAALVRDDLAASETAPRAPSEPEVTDRVRFADEAAAAGLRFVFESGTTSLHQLPETMAGGVGLLDYDGDGFLDVYAVQGGKFPPDPDPTAAKSGDRLFRNKGDGTFEDATARSGVGQTGGGYGHGVAVGDVDNDGYPDLFLTRWRGYRLLHNQGNGTFEDVTARAGLGGDRDWPTSAAFADLDGDGDLDLYVCHYVAWDEADPRLCRSPAKPGYTSCDPKALEPRPDHAFRNDGGRFTDVTAEAGLSEHSGRGLGVVAADLDGDGRIDLFVANDGSANFLWRNKGGFRFEEAGLVAGVSANASGGYQAGMGVACGDLDGDGLADLVVTNFYNEATSFFRNLGRGFFADRTAAVGLASASRPDLGFGVALLDADGDGRLDLLTANGHVNDFRPAVPYAMPARLLLGGPGGVLADVSGRAGEPFRAGHLGRGLAAGDLDNDGRPDALLVALDEPLVLLRNRTPDPGRSLTLALEGKAPASNRDAVGSVVTVRAGGRARTGIRAGGGSYLSAPDPRLHFGLGASRSADSVGVRWPSGRIDTYPGLETGRGYRLREGDPAPRPLPGSRVQGP